MDPWKLAMFAVPSHDRYTWNICAIYNFFFLKNNNISILNLMFSHVFSIQHLTALAKCAKHKHTRWEDIHLYYCMFTKVWVWVLQAIRLLCLFIVWVFECGCVWSHTNIWVDLFASSFNYLANVLTTDPHLQYLNFIYKIILGFTEKITLPRKDCLHLAEKQPTA